MDETLRMALTVSKYREDTPDPKPSWISITTITMFAKQLIDNLYALMDFQRKVIEGSTIMKFQMVPHGPTALLGKPKIPTKKGFLQ